MPLLYLPSAHLPKLYLAPTPKLSGLGRSGGRSEANLWQHGHRNVKNKYTSRTACRLTPSDQRSVKPLGDVWSETANIPKSALKKPLPAPPHWQLLGYISTSWQHFPRSIDEPHLQTMRLHIYIHAPCLWNGPSYITIQPLY